MGWRLMGVAGFCNGEGGDVWVLSSFRRGPRQAADVGVTWTLRLAEEWDLT